MLNSINKILLSLLICISDKTVKSQIKGTGFTVASSGDPTVTSDSISILKAFQQVRDGGFNTLLGEQYKILTNSDSINKRYLNLVAQAGLNIFFIDTRFNPRTEKLPLEKSISAIKMYKSVSLKSNKSLTGFNLFDEPGFTDTARIKSWIYFYKKNFPRKSLYLNLLPVYGFESADTYKKYLTYYINILYRKLNQPEIVCVDFYPFLKNKALRPNYFYNLQLFKELLSKDQLFWSYILTTEHGPYPEQSFYNFCFSAFSPILYGADGIVYFTYETVPYVTNYQYKEGLIDLKGNPTIRYYYAQRINYFIKKIVEPVVKSSSLIGVYHMNKPVNDNIGDTYLFNAKSPFIKSISDTSIVYSIYKSNSTKENFLFFFNKSDRSLNQINVSFKSPVTSAFLSDRLEKKDLAFGYYSLPIRSKENTKTSIDFAPGELRVLKVTMDNKIK